VYRGCVYERVRKLGIDCDCAKVKVGNRPWYTVTSQESLKARVLLPQPAQFIAFIRVHAASFLARLTAKVSELFILEAVILTKESYLDNVWGGEKNLDEDYRAFVWHDTKK